MVTKTGTLFLSITLFYLSGLLSFDVEEFYIEKSPSSTNFSIKTVHFLPDNKFIYKTKETFEGGEEEIKVTNIIVCDRRTRIEYKVQRPLLEADQKIYRVLISPSGKTIVYLVNSEVHKTTQLYFYDILTRQTKTFIYPLQQYYNRHNKFSFTHDSSKFGISTYDWDQRFASNHIKIYVIDIIFDDKDLEFMEIDFYDKELYSIAFTPDNQTMLCSMGQSRLVDLRSQQKKEIKIGCLNNLIFSPDGKTLVGFPGASVGTKGIRVFDYVANDQDPFMYYKNHIVQFIKKLNIHDCCSASIHSLKFSPDSSKLVSTGEYSYHHLDIWNIHNHSNIFTTTLEAKFNYAEFSHDGHEVISASDDGIIRIWSNFDNNDAPRSNS